MFENILNTPEYANEYNFIVARHCDGDWWFWGAYEDEATAHKAANEIHGAVFER